MFSLHPGRPEKRPLVRSIAYAPSFVERSCGAVQVRSNVVSKTNARDEVFPAKEKEDLKIDGPVALIMAMARAMANVSTKSVYEGRGLVVIGG
jgi:hypothetical protein